MAAFQCTYCGSGRLAARWTLPDRHYRLPGSFEVAVCVQCRSTRVLDPPEDVGEYYPEEYYSATGTAYRPVEWKLRLYDVLRRARLGRLATRVLGGLFARTDVDLATELPPGRMLDVGCGGGWMLDFYRDHGWETWGVDIGSGIEAAADRGHHVIVGDVLEAAVPEGLFDLVRGTHVVEHVLDPPELVERMASWVAPGGVLFLELPNIDGLLARLFGPAYWQLDPPRHLSIPAAGPLCDAVADAGFVGIRAFTYSRPGGWSTSLYLALQRLGWPTLQDWRMSDPSSPVQKVLRAIGVPLGMVADTFGRGDNLCLLAVRPPMPDQDGTPRATS